MKKDYEFWANEKTINNLDLYTKLAGTFFFSLGLNFLLVFIYCKFAIKYEFSGLVLILSILMFVLAPIVMIDPKKGSRNLIAIISYGIVHSVCTIVNIWATRFWLLCIVYGIELLLVILLLITKKRPNNKQ